MTPVIYDSRLPADSATNERINTRRGGRAEGGAGEKGELSRGSNTSLTVCGCRNMNLWGVGVRARERMGRGLHVRYILLVARYEIYLLRASITYGAPYGIEYFRALFLFDLKLIVDVLLWNFIHF